MIKLLNIQVEGFCSIVELQTIPLNVGGTVLIKAPNGSGKTSLFSALSWGLFGKSLKGKTEVNTWKQFRPSNYPGTKVMVTWESEKGVYQLTRYQNYTGKLEDGAKGGNRIILVKDGEPLKVKGKIKIQEIINQNLGFSFELFTSSIMFGQGMKRLIQESNADKKKIFEEIFNLEYLSVAKSIATDERNQIQSEYNSQSSKLKSLERELTLLKESYQEIKEKEDNFTKLNREAIRDKERKIEALHQERKELKKKKSKEDFGEQYQDLKESLSKVEDKIEKAENLQDIPLKDLIQNTINLIEANKVDKALTNLKKIQTSFITAEELRKKASQIQKSMAKAKDQYNSQKMLLSKLRYMDESINQLGLDIHNLKGQTLKLTAPKYHKKILDLNPQIVKLRKDIEILDNKLKDYNWILSDPLSNNGIKAFLFDSSLQTLNENLEKYADTLGFRIEFNVNLDSARKDFVTLIERDGLIIEYEELSGGEKGLVNLTMCLALHETLTLSKGINILLLDEVFENLDADNIELVISLIRTLSEGKTIFLISHIQNLPFGNCKALEVCKNNGHTHYSSL